VTFFKLINDLRSPRKDVFCIPEYILEFILFKGEVIPEQRHFLSCQNCQISVIHVIFIAYWSTKWLLIIVIY